MFQGIELESMSSGHASNRCQAPPSVLVDEKTTKGRRARSLAALQLIVLITGCVLANGCPPDESDSTPPDAIQDLVASASATGGVRLSWTAPGDDGRAGRAASYDVRYQAASLTTMNWASALRVSNVPTPAVAGSPESFVAYGMSPGTTYFFAVRAEDEKGNASGLSNVASAAPGSGETGSWAAFSPATPLVASKRITGFARFQNHLIACGDIIGSNSQFFQGVAQWTGAQWAGTGFGIAAARNPVVAGSRLYVISSSDLLGSPGLIASWDGSSWILPNSSLPGPEGLTLSGATGVQSLVATPDGSLYIAGTLAHSPAEPRFDSARIVRWHDNKLTQLPSESDWRVDVLGVHGQLLVAGGSFPSLFPQSPHSGVIEWDGGGWQPLGGVFSSSGGSSGVISVFETFENQLIAAGYFKFMNGVTPISNPARWNGTAWVGIGMDHNIVSDMIVHRGRLFVTDYSSVSAYGNSAWELLPALPEIETLFDYDGTLLAGHGNSGYPLGYVIRFVES